MDTSVTQTRVSPFSDVTEIGYRRIESGLATCFCGDGNASPDFAEYAGNFLDTIFV
jgi:hypothetical protein